MSEARFEEFGPNSGFVEELYELYLKDSALVPKKWSDFFAKQKNGSINAQTLVSNGHQQIEPGRSRSLEASGSLEKQEKVTQFINAYRQFGHLRAQINPLQKGVMALPENQELDPSFYGFTEEDLNQSFSCAGLSSQTTATLREIIALAQNIYCGSVGFEYTHLVKPEQREFLKHRIESGFTQKPYDSAEQRLMLKKLIDAEEFESQLHKKYVGQKRFSLQGGETVIAMLDNLLRHSPEHGAREVVIGMAHRGRLNVLVNTVGKPLEKIFSEFEDQAYYSVLGSGDVKYHKGYESVFQPEGASASSAIKISLAPNPSHLEAVDPVVEGMVRAKQDIDYSRNRAAVVPLLIHGDAAMAGQGVVFETFNFSLVDGYSTGGTLHVVINNQIGFTTNPEDSRSSVYCTDMAKAVESPIFHVNCEDIDACCRVMELALEFRQRYQQDVVVDLYCFRKYGHNEGDDPSFTQPIAYSEINSKKSAAQVFADALIAAGTLSADEFAEMRKSYQNLFDSIQKNKHVPILGEACALHGRLRIPTPSTGIPIETLTKIANTLLTYPEGFKPHPKLLGILEKRVQTLREGKGIDWGFAEGLAFGSLVVEGHHVRLSGQDCGRGTFSQRHLALNNNIAAERYLPFSLLSDPNAVARFEVFNSTLSEAGIVGFEFGYAATAPDSLVLWEGQFGDFANGAQILIDQFIASSEAKWEQLCGLVLLLPHGYEGQGPEHSSARLERYLQLCGDGNMVVAYPSNAAQQFHLVRRQGIMQMKRPLIVMTPKSLLRLPEASCKASDLTEGQFQTVLETNLGAPKSKKEHLVLCSGKVYYDLLSGLKAAGWENEKGPSRVKIVRVEQLYPFPQFDIKKVIKSSSEYASCTWVQEEPQNMGAWSYIDPYIRGKLDFEPTYVGRPTSASPSAGSLKRHNAEQKAIVDQVLQIVGA